MKELFNISEKDDHINVSILSDNYVLACKETLKDFVETYYNIPYAYVNFITGLCWVNMSPLHMLNPVCKLLFYMGKLTMYQSLREMENY